MRAKRALARIRPPDESGAQARAWDVVRYAYHERAPSGRRRPHARRVLILAGAVLAGALALSPAGATVGRLVSRALGIQHASPALFSLPAPGRLLVSGSGGTWTVAADGSTRRLGPWTGASWSPHGLYVTVTSRDQLAAVDTRGNPHWALARPMVSDPEWYPPTGYRLAYLSGRELRVVAGDGTGDHLLAAGVAKVAPAWRGDHPYELAYVSGQGRLVVRDADTGALLRSAKTSSPITRLAWSDDGKRLLAVSRTAARVYAANGALGWSVALSRDAAAIDASLSPDGHSLALLQQGSGGDIEVLNLDDRQPRPHRVLAGKGLRQVAWAPNGKWLLVSWPAADQWVFVRVAGAPRIAAVSRIAQQFSARPGQAFPQLEGWCCTAAGSGG